MGVTHTSNVTLNTPGYASPNPWVILHGRYSAAIQSGQWDEKTEQIWLDEEFSKLIPCGSCGSKWLEIKPLIDLSSAESAFKSSWEVHNIVSTQHVVPAKEPITFEECQALYLK